MVEIGYKNKANERNLLSGKSPIWVYNLKDIDKAGKDNVIIIGKIGLKNKLAIAKEIQKRKLGVFNLNINKFLKENEKQTGDKK